MDLGLRRKVALVTGAGEGIGKAIALAFASHGAAVVLAEIRPESGERTAGEITAAGGRAIAVPTDVREAAQVGEAVRTAEREFGGLDVLHANAGIALAFRGDGFAPQIDPADWDRVIRVNLSGVFHCVHHAVPAMAARGGGSIITTASSMSTVPLGGMDAYAASKGGVAMLTKSMAPGCGPLGIRINAIGPGYVETPMNGVILDDPTLTGLFAAGHADGHLQTPDEIGDLVVFLASDRASHISGAQLRIDAGLKVMPRAK